MTKVQALRQRRSSMSGRVTNALGDMLFWVLLALDVYGACYWVASQIARLLIAVGWLQASRALVFALISGALITPGVLAGLISLFKRIR